MTNPIEALRAALSTRVPAPLVVTDQPQQYYFDEDSAAWCEIDVQDPQRFLLVVVKAGGSSAVTDFKIRAWLHYASEVWVVHEEARQVTIARPQQPQRIITSGDVCSEAVPGLVVPISLIFG